MQAHTTLIKTTAALALAAGTTAAQATLIAYDPFLSGTDRAAGEYTPQVDMRTMGAAATGWVGTQGIDGFGVSHTGSTGNFQANDLGENNAAVDYEQGGRMQWIGVGNFPFDRNITRQLNPTPSSSEWYFSIMVNRLGWADVDTHTYVVGGFTDANGSGLQVGYDETNDDFIPDLVLRMGGVNRTLAADVGSNDNQLVLVKLEINESGNDTVSVWVDPASVFDPADVVFTDTNVSDSLTPFTQSKYESPGQSGVAYFDEIRLATTFQALHGQTPALPGDTDGDGDIDDSDLGTAFSNYTGPLAPGTGGKTAADGDTDGDGDVDDSDLGTAFSGYTGPLGPAAVPEPTSLALLGLGGLLVARRRRA
ncbi:MAG: PEP-CTERM sorting domain-containing protein [Phycisphaeraceae bacterium]